MTTTVGALSSGKTSTGVRGSWYAGECEQHAGEHSTSVALSSEN
jgi:hypothetical protein